MQVTIKAENLIALSAEINAELDRQRGAAQNPNLHLRSSDAKPVMDADGKTVGWSAVLEIS